MSANSYSKTYRIRWSDLDPNWHVRNTAYGDYATDVRFSYMESRGLSSAQLAEMHIGPVAFSESTRYLRELHMDDTFTIGLEIAALAPDGTHWRMRHTVRREDGKTAAVIDMEGAWLDLERRKLTVPPAPIVAALQAMPHSDDFEELESGKKPR